MAFCSHCGKEITTDSKFCAHCGKQVSIVNNSNATPSSPAQDLNKIEPKHIPKLKSNSKLNLLRILIILGALVLATIVIIIMRGTSIPPTLSTNFKETKIIAGEHDDYKIVSKINILAIKQPSPNIFHVKVNLLTISKRGELSSGLNISAKLKFVGWETNRHLYSDRLAFENGNSNEYEFIFNTNAALTLDDIHEINFHFYDNDDLLNYSFFNGNAYGGVTYLNLRQFGK